MELQKIFCATAVLLSAGMFAASSAFAGGDLPPPLTDADFFDGGNPDANKVSLGKFLYTDKILSGNQNIACATCHHALTDTGDGLSLPVGEGGRGLGMARDTGSGGDAIHERVPRNAPPVFNLGAKQLKFMFHDGRVSANPGHPSGFNSPAGDDLPAGLDNILAVQAMFPVTSGAEMAGQPGENDVANAAAAGNLAGPGGVWELLALRLQAIPEYVNLFIATYDDVSSAADITFVHAANAIAAFEASAWRADNSPYDRYLRGDHKAMSKAAKKGMDLFNGKAGCVSCHSGVLQTDQDFHAIAMPQIGGGKGHGVGGIEDIGRGAISGDAGDNYKFRTPSLRNVALTGPWGHDGAFNTLEDVVKHHLNPEQSLFEYDINKHSALPSRADLDEIDRAAQDNPTIVANIWEASELKGVTELSDKEFMYLMDFLHALTDPVSVDLRIDVPKYVPSNLPLAD